MLKIIHFIALVAFAAAAEKINTDLSNKNVQRTVDLTSQLVKITSVVTVKNDGKEPANVYLVAVEPNAVGHLAFIGVKDSVKTELAVIEVQVDGMGKDKLFYQVSFIEPLETNRTITITIEQIFTQALEPYPSSITQKEKQLVRYFGNHYFYSPYPTVKQNTNIEVTSRNVESYTKLKPVSQSDAKILYGPYVDVAALTVDKLLVHYENSSPFLTVTRIHRTIEVSHWGNIAVEESLEIRHTGAKLKGSFSRYDYQRDSQSNHHSIKSYRTFLPANSHSIYYRDMNGNISTSSVKTRKEWTELELRPRFPLFGGWQSSYVLGYSVPSNSYLFKKPWGEFVLNVRLLDHIFDDMYVQDLETSIVLPVGVSGIKVKTPYEVKRLSDGVTYKYLDNIGRTVIRFAKNNLVEQHIQDVEITYNWSPHLLMHEPLLVSLALFVLFILVIIYVRLDFSISKSENVKKD